MKHDECMGFVSEILNVLRTTHQHEEVLHLIVDRIVRMYRCQTCAVILVDPATEYLHVELGFGLSHTFAKAFRRTVATGSAGKLLWTGTPILVSDSEVTPDQAEDLRLEYPFRSAVCVQISANHRSLGYLHVDSTQPGTFSRDDVHLIQTFANFAAVALHKAQLFEDNLRLDNVDHETELVKYAPFLERIRAAIDRSNTLHESFSLTIFDVDNFKQVVNTYGYKASREMLKQIADMIKSRLRVIDVPGRHGFDEFIVLRANSELVDGVMFADEIREAVSRTSFTDRGILSTVSAGVSVYPHHATDLETLLRSTREALFEAQRSGRNKVSHVGKEQISQEARVLHD